jgi:hypothetical protein
MPATTLKPELLLTETNERVPRLALRPREASIALGLSERKLWSLTAEGAITCSRAGRVKLYAVDELRDFLRRNAKGGDDR